MKKRIIGKGAGGKRKAVTRPIMDRFTREAAEAAAIASWDALETYRDTGEMVPVMKAGRLALVTVDEAMRMRDDYAERKAANAAWRRQNLINQFKLAGLELTPDVWERLAADRRQALADDLAWMRPDFGGVPAETDFSSHSRKVKTT